MPRILALAVATLVVVSPFAVVAQDTARAAPTPRRPNIVFLFSDDHAPPAIGAYGGRYAALDPTPNIDRLARDGMVFRQSFCTNSICGPSRAVILTGKHSHVNGFRKNGDRFDGDQVTFPKLLRAAGYRTAMIGKWHLASDPQGFDEWHVLPGQGEYYNPEFLSPTGRHRIEGYCTDIITDLAIEWLEQRRGEDAPFLLMCQHKAPHRNWMPPERYLDLYDDVEIPEPDTLFDRWEDNASPAREQEMEVERDLDLIQDLFVDPDAAGDAPRSRAADPSGLHNLERMTASQRAAWDRAFAAENAAFRAQRPTGRELVRWKYQRYLKNYLRCVRALDDGVGRILDWLDEHGLAENTIVVYSSDQGFFLGDHGWFDKRWIYEESLRMPLIVRWPGKTAKGVVDEHLVQNIDYAPTFLDAAGVTIPAAIQGESLVPLLCGRSDAPWRDAIYYHYYGNPDIHRVARHYGIRDAHSKLIHFYQSGEWEYYDLDADPDELVNRFTDPANRARIAELAVRLGELRARYAVPPDTDPAPAPKSRR